MEWHNFVMIALAVLSSLAPIEILAASLTDEFDRKQLNNNLILGSWEDGNSEGAVSSTSGLITDGFEKKQSAFTHDVEVFEHPEKQQYSSDDAQRDAEELLFPSDEEHYASEEHSRESRECPYRRKMRLQAMKRQRYNPDRWGYRDDYRKKRSSDGKLDEKNETLSSPELAVDSTNVTNESSDSLKITKRDVEGDVTGLDVNHCCHQNSQDQRVFKRSTNFSENEGQPDSNQKKYTVGRLKRSIENDQVHVGNQKVAKRSASEMFEDKSHAESKAMKVSKRSIDKQSVENFRKNFGKAVEVCCKNSAISKIYDNAKEFAKFKRDKSQQTYSQSKINSIVRSAGMSRNPQGHRIQKRRINLVMNDPDFVDLGLNPKQIGDCVNEMLAVPGFTELGLDWQILGDHWRHFFTLMKDLHESYSLGLFSAIRELTNFHRWMHMNLIQKPYASGSFTDYYYKRRHELNQPSIWNYAEKPVFGRPGPYWLYQEYVPKWEPWYVKDFTRLADCNVEITASGEDSEEGREEELL